MSGSHRRISIFLTAWVFSALLAGCPPIDPIDVENPAGVLLERDAGTFTPGQHFTVTITISADDGGAISALGLTEFAPEGWTFVEVNGNLGQVPPILPQQGDSGELGFMWLAVPDFPLTFSYTLLAPPNADRSAAFNGRVFYYQNVGILSSDEVNSNFAINPDILAENPAGVVLARELGAYAPDEEVTVTITVQAEDGESITAIGLTEFVPDGWRFVNAESASNQAPAVTPPVDDTGELDFLWLTVPEFPVTFSYTLLVPQSASGTVEITGRVDYYQDAGILSSEDVQTSTGALS